MKRLDDMLRLKNFIRYFAIFSIYLIISLTFITAQALAVLTYDVKGDAGTAGFVHGKDSLGFGDNIEVNVKADVPNVSFVTASNDEIPLSCSNNGNISDCVYYFPQSDIPSGISHVQFKLRQAAPGLPSLINGEFYIDTYSPTGTINAVKSSNGLLVSYTTQDYLTNTGESGCQGSGIGHVEVIVQGSIKYSRDITTKNCTVNDTFYVNMTNRNDDKVFYSMKILDRAGNEYNTEQQNISGDFRAPLITGPFKIMQGLTELSSFSSSADVTANIVFTIDDRNLNDSTVYGDLSNVNSNPAVSYGYKNVKASCNKDNSQTSYICTFSNIIIRPSNSTLRIMVNATDTDENTMSTFLNSKILTLKDNAGQVLYLGPDTTQCTTDLSRCFTKSGRNLFYIELDGTSSFNRTLLNLGVDGEKRFAICRFNDPIWKCAAVSDVQNTSSSINLYMAESYDDFGNAVITSLERNIDVDDIAPENITVLTVANSNNNINCSVSGDTLSIKLKVKEANPEIKIFVNTSTFTTKPVQTGTCTLTGTSWDCVLNIKDFVSTPTNIVENIVLKDLAGNTRSIPFTFNVCQSSTTATPDVISSVTQNSIPSIDRRTASYMPVKVYIPVTINNDPSSTLMYLTVDRCVGGNIGNNLDFMKGSGNYFFPKYGSSSQLVLSVGYSGAIMPEGSVDINCTVSARVRVGGTVFLRDEKETFTVKVNAFNNPLGTPDSTTISELQAVKAQLRDIEATEKKYADITGFFDTICGIAELLGTINSVVQAIRGVIWGVLVVLTSTQILKTGAEGIWKAINPSLGGFHRIIENYVWPTGMLNFNFGMLLKGVCFVYTCKHLDFGSYLNVGLEFGGGANPFSKSLGHTGGNLGNYQYMGKDSFLDSDVSYNIGGANAERMVNGINAHQWLVNPYRSTHYDDTCMPAILFNTRKEKQINCLYMSCLQNNVKAGLPVTVCKRQKAIDSCLYLESAEYKLTGDSAFEEMWKNFFKLLLNNLAGIGLSLAYLWGCSDYSAPVGEDEYNVIEASLRGVLCGISGAALNAKEVYNSFHNPLLQFWNKNKEIKPDYCQGLDWSEGTSGGEGSAYYGADDFTE
jgi:hypothetical protein